MTQKEFDKLDKQSTIDMFNEIDKNYADLDLPIVKPVYKKDGSLKNEKEVKSSLKRLLPLLTTLWTTNLVITEDKSVKTMIYTNTLINTLKKASNNKKTMISVAEWQVIMKQTIAKRIKQVKIKQVIKGNAKRLNKNVQKIVIKMYKDGKSWVQTSKELQEVYKYNSSKAKSIAITEKNFYKSEAQIEATKGVDNVQKTWIHNGAREPRATHLSANGQIANKDGFFTVDGLKTKAPQHFGKPSQDINCHCTMRIDIEK